MIKDHITTSVHFGREDLDYPPIDTKGGVGRMYRLFGDEMDSIIDEMNEELVAWPYSSPLEYGLSYSNKSIYIRIRCFIIQQFRIWEKSIIIICPFYLLREIFGLR